MLYHSNWASTTRARRWAHDFCGLWLRCVARRRLDASYTLDNDEKKRLFQFGLQRRHCCTPRLWPADSQTAEDREAARWALEHLAGKAELHEAQK